MYLCFEFQLERKATNTNIIIIIIDPSSYLAIVVVVRRRVNVFILNFVIVYFMLISNAAVAARYRPSGGAIAHAHTLVYASENDILFLKNAYYDLYLLTK